MKFVITFNSTVQVTEDHWARRKKTMIADGDTTLEQIRAWYAKEDRVKEANRLYEPLTITEGEEVVTP